MRKIICEYRICNGNMDVCLALNCAESYLESIFLFLIILQIYHIPQFCIQMAYLMSLNENNRNNVSSIVHISMILSVWSIFMSLMSQTSRIYEFFCPKSNKYSIETNISMQLLIKSDYLSKKHSFANIRIERCIEDVLHASELLKHKINQSDILYEIECYYFDSQITTLLQMTAFIDIKILSFDINSGKKIKLFHKCLKNFGKISTKESNYLKIALKKQLKLYNNNNNNNKSTNTGTTLAKSPVSSPL